MGTCSPSGYRHQQSDSAGETSVLAEQLEQIILDRTNRATGTLHFQPSKMTFARSISQSESVAVYVLVAGLLIDAVIERLKCPKRISRMAATAICASIQRFQ
jgi:hypothetical protein